MQALEVKTSGSYRRNIYEGYLSVDDAKLAEYLINEYKNGKDSAVKSMLEKGFAAGYPGVKWSAKDKTATLVSAKK